MPRCSRWRSISRYGKARFSVNEDDKMSSARAPEFPSDVLAHVPAFCGVKRQPPPYSEANKSLCRSLRPQGSATCAFAKESPIGVNPEGVENGFFKVSRGFACDHRHFECRSSRDSARLRQARCRRSLASIPMSRMPQVWRNASSLISLSSKQRTKNRYVASQRLRLAFGGRSPG